MKRVIGIDPDSDRHGVAVYVDGVLTELLMLNMYDLILMVQDWPKADTLFVIEETSANKFVYTRNQHISKHAQSKIAMAIGRNQQAQIELTRFLQRLGFKVSLIPPTAGNWADRKAQFEKVTGWNGRSNPDKRSAAFFGFMGLGG